ncbi:unnamed protein product [Bursaphelenchus okinawaensis]|uniref:Peptidase M13 N-terminal domain-containing protein n=1 Tax=Bursaphelenchus okinawaensis TaxID=465554 RepID=A0A811L557_9BILA|nr:unnamed protein product [Bursaphelenchus okinawaensis]CAG9116903.1 unnamed protein product [Bursaphelenchus okinawaensis]
MHDRGDYSRPHVPPRLPVPPPPPINRPRPNDKPNIFFNPNFTFSRIFKRTVPMVKKPMPIQQVATVLIPIFLTMITVIVCVIVGIAFLTDGYSYCGEKTQMTVENDDKTCLSRDCIVHSGRLLSSLDETIDPCKDFYQYSCGHKVIDQILDTSFDNILKERLEEKPRPSFPTPQRLLFDYYDSCMNEEYQNQLDLIEFSSLISKLGGWHLLQNAKFDNESVEFEKLEMELHKYGTETLIFVKDDTISTPKFMQETYKEQNLHEFFLNLLTEMDVDIDLAQVAVEKVLRLEEELIRAKNKGLFVKIKGRTLELDYPHVEWKVFFGDDKSLGMKRSVNANPSYLGKLNELNEDLETTINYQMMRFLLSLAPSLSRKYRRHLKDLNDDIKPRWKQCVDELKHILPVPLLQFSKKMTKSTVKRGLELTEMKSRILRKIKAVDWIDYQSKETLFETLDSITVTNFDTVNWEKIREIYKKERLDPTSYFENVMILRQINAQTNSILENEKWTGLLEKDTSMYITDTSELILSPSTIIKVEGMNQLHKDIYISSLIYKVLFGPDFLKRLNRETHSVINSKLECFKNKSTDPEQLFYTICAFESIEVEPDNMVSLPGLGEFSSQKLFYLDYSTSECAEPNQRLNQIMQHLDGFAEAMKCPVGTAMNPKQKCNVF